MTKSFIDRTPKRELSNSALIIGIHGVLNGVKTVQENYNNIALGCFKDFVVVINLRKGVSISFLKFRDVIRVFKTDIVRPEKSLGHTSYRKVGYTLYNQIHNASSKVFSHQSYHKSRRIA